MTLDELVDSYAANPASDIGLHLGRLIELVVELDARTVIELGTRWGESTAAFLAALDRTEGVLWSIDITDCVRQVHELVRSHPRWRFRQGDDLDWVEHLPACDVCFVDTSHTLEQTRAELAAYEPLVKPGGAIALHDTTSNPPVWQAVMEFADAHPDWELEHNPACNGLAILRKPMLAPVSDKA